MLSFHYNQKLVTLLNTGVHGLFGLTGTRLNKAFTTRRGQRMGALVWEGGSCKNSPVPSALWKNQTCSSNPTCNDGHLREVRLLGMEGSSIATAANMQTKLPCNESLLLNPISLNGCLKNLIFLSKLSHKCKCMEEYAL